MLREVQGGERRPCSCDRSNRDPKPMTRQCRRPRHGGGATRVGEDRRWWMPDEQSLDNSEQVRGLRFWARRPDWDGGFDSRRVHPHHARSQAREAWAARPSGGGLDASIGCDERVRGPRFQQGGEAVTRGAHNPEIVGSIPTPATSEREGAHASRSGKLVANRTLPGVSRARWSSAAGATFDSWTLTRLVRGQHYLRAQQAQSCGSKAPECAHAARVARHDGVRVSRSNRGDDHGPSGGSARTRSSARERGGLTAQAPARAKAKSSAKMQGQSARTQQSGSCSPNQRRGFESVRGRRFVPARSGRSIRCSNGSPQARAVGTLEVGTLAGAPWDRRWRRGAALHRMTETLVRVQPIPLVAELAKLHPNSARMVAEESSARGGRRNVGVRDDRGSCPVFPAETRARVRFESGRHRPFCSGGAP